MHVEIAKYNRIFYGHCIGTMLLNELGYHLQWTTRFIIIIIIIIIIFPMYM